MNTSIFLAKVFSLYLMVTTLAIFINHQRFIKIVRGIAHDEALAFFTSIFTFIIGLLLVLSHNIWVEDWRVLITLFSWLILIKGGLGVLVANPGLAAVKATENKAYYFTSGIIMFIIALFLAYKGFGPV